MIKYITLLITATLIVVCYCGCEKEEGPGGTSIIKGKVMTKIYDTDYKVLQRIIPAADENIYIIYGDDDFISDKTVTNYDGSFSFEYLISGSYKIVMYTEDTSGYLNKNATVLQELKVGNSKTLTLDTLYKISSVDLDEGYASISGKIRSINFSEDFRYIIDTTVALDREVYLIYGDHTVFDQRNRTSYNGMYTFKNLLIGSYTMYVYSEDTIIRKNNVFKVTTPRIYKFTVNELNRFYNEKGEEINSIPDIFIKHEL